MLEVSKVASHTACVESSIRTILLVMQIIYWSSGEYEVFEATWPNRSVKNRLGSVESHCLEHYSWDWSDFLIQHIWILALRLHLRVSVSSETSLCNGFYFHMHSKTFFLFNYTKGCREHRLRDIYVMLYITFTCDTALKSHWPFILLVEKIAKDIC